MGLKEINMFREVVFYVTMFLSGSILVAFAYLLYLIFKFFNEISKNRKERR